MTQLQVGSVLPISVKLSDENTARTVTAQVLNEAGTVIIDNITLTHRLNGFYLNSGYTMPDLPSVTVLYKVHQGDVFLISASEVIVRMPDVVPVLMLNATLDLDSLSASIADPVLNANIIEGEQ